MFLRQKHVVNSLMKLAPGLNTYQPYTIGATAEMNRQQQDHRPKRTAAATIHPAEKMGGLGLKYSIGRIFVLDSADIKTIKVVSSHGGFIHNTVF